MTRRICPTLLAALCLFFGHAGAQDWPARPVKFVISQPPGTSPDITARFLADRVGRLLGQSVVVENRPGGQNVIGAQAAAKAPPDGYTYFFATTAAIVTNPLTFKALPYDPERDFAPVAMIAKSPMVVAVNPGVQARTLAELVALDKAQPGRLAAANEGTKTFSGMMSQMLNKTAGIRLLQVPYTGVAPAIQDTIAGRTQVVLVSSAALLPFLKRGDLRPLAVSAGKRVRGLEEVPTLAESYPGFEYVGWFALLAPAGTPAHAVQRMNREMDRVLADPEVAQRLYDLGLVNEGAGTPESLSEFLRAERERWARLVKEIGLQPD
ncbi:MAG TPA: tripartite tricarboxylate transporter substrate-binding protein [Burkholderiales bacterium]|nr:tripartite tricarboxylate transporter substrate-binding protein [Burkholderiales bacterium]